MQTIFIQEEETQILKSIKAIRISISHIKQDPKISAHQELHHHILMHSTPSLPEVFTDLHVYLPAH